MDQAKLAQQTISKGPGWGGGGWGGDYVGHQESPNKVGYFKGLTCPRSVLGTGTCTTHTPASNEGVDPE